MLERISPNFSLTEFIKSSTAAKLRVGNMPTAPHYQNLRICAMGLEQVRAILFDNRVTVMSGYRNPRINAAVGGSPTSGHALGYAADIVVEDYTPLEVATALSQSFLVFDQLIYEPSRGIVHISFDPRLRRQVLTQRGGPGSPIEQGIAV